MKQFKEDQELAIGKCYLVIKQYSIWNLWHNRRILSFFQILLSLTHPSHPCWGDPDLCDVCDICTWEHCHHSGGIPEWCVCPCLWHHSSPSTWGWGAGSRSVSYKLEKLTSLKRDKSRAGGIKAACAEEWRWYPANWAGEDGRGARRIGRKARVPGPYLREAHPGSFPPGCFAFWLFFISNLKEFFFYEGNRQVNYYFASCLTWGLETNLFSPFVGLNSCQEEEMHPRKLDRRKIAFC